MPGYSPLDRLLHRLALTSRPIAELSFDIDQTLARGDAQRIVGERHVFIAGLARAGTTVLMRRFHGTGRYRSLTYRDMPFVLAPNLWQRLAGRSRRRIAPAERAHGDGIMVDADSPESLEEVFWRVFHGADYIRDTHLAPHEPDPEAIDRFVGYVNAVLAAAEPRRARYLSKNNNNVLRLGAVRRAFPEALVLIPFREPLAQAGSLLHQHRRFARVQAEDPFVGAYMAMLAHHEFGLEHRPFRFPKGPAEPHADGAAERLDYWLERWCDAYEWLERTAPDGAVLVCYEDLCADPAVWPRLADRAGIDPATEQGPLVAVGAVGEAAADPALAGRAAALYDRLAERSRASLG